MANQLDIQLALAEKETLAVPCAKQLQQWVDTALSLAGHSNNEVTLRFVDNVESQALNFQYRGKEKPTNVLSFPFENPPGLSLPFLGDLVLCVPVIAQEADAQRKTLNNHYAHMIAHGCLHLLGYDHENDEDAEEMESLEKSILAELGIDDPYQDD